MEIDASQPDLLDQLHMLIVQRNDAAEAFDVFKQDVAMAPEPDGVPAGPSSEDAADVAAEAVDSFAAQTEALLRAASDDAILAAYRETDGDVGDLAAETLRGEIARRHLTA